MEGMDVFTERAMGILTSPELFNALDVSKEDPHARTLRQRRTKTGRWATVRRACRRTCSWRGGWSKPGVRVVTINYSFWDWHGRKLQERREGTAQSSTRR